MVVFVIIFLFFGAGIVSSTDNSLTNTPVDCPDNFLTETSADCSPLESLISSEEKTFPNTAWYMFLVMSGEGSGFYAIYPNGTYKFRKWEGDGSFSGGTWTNDGKYLCCMYENGTLYDVDPETLEPSAIGDGGVSLNGLAYNPRTKELYGASSTDLYKIDETTGQQTYIGAFGISSAMIAIAFDYEEGICYGWDVKFSGEAYLYKINTSTGEATIVGGMGLPLCYMQDGAFEYDTDTLYLVAYYSYAFLAECDEDTGECIEIGNLEYYAAALAISYDIDNDPPITMISFDPPVPDGCNGWYVSNVTVTLKAIDVNSVKATYYRINGGDWWVYDSPFVISEEGEDILIEYYSVDYLNNVEDVKSATLDIDKTPPEIDIDWYINKIGWNRWRVTFNIDISNETSGIDRIEIFINDGLHSVVTGPGPTYSWSFVISGDLFFTLKFVAYDQACNQAIVIVNSSEINTFPSIKSNNYQTRSVGFSHFFERFPLIQRLLESLGWYG